MSSDIAVQLVNLTKIYKIYQRPIDRLKQFFNYSFFSSYFNFPKTYFTEARILNNLSFEIKQGETVAIIGRNGSGKSTLLQVICGIIEASSGDIQINGKIAALLELGAGFNPDFTGRENVYMNGALFGLSKTEIDARFDEITKFADIGSYIDQPVKTYSSGMYVRLAFAIIVHVNADILVVDEALAVGDAVFAQKCFRFLRNFKKTGTLIFVSHDTSAVINLCDRAIWLHNGDICEIGNSKVVVEKYLQYTLQESYGPETVLDTVNLIDEPLKLSANLEVNNSISIEYPGITNYENRFGIKNNLTQSHGWKTGSGEIIGATFELLNTDVTSLLQGGELVQLKITAILNSTMQRPIVGFLVRDKLGQDLFGENTLAAGAVDFGSFQIGDQIQGNFIFKLPMLLNGKYFITISLADGDLTTNIQHHWLHDAIIFDVFSNKNRWGLFGVEFEHVELKVLK